jgi:hypothetical protein
MSIRTGVLRLAQVVKGLAVLLPITVILGSKFIDGHDLWTREGAGAIGISVAAGAALWALAWVMQGFAAD